MQNNDSRKIIARFFWTIRTLIELREIRGKKTFTDRYGINRWNFNTLQKNQASDIFQVGWLYYLVRDFGVSADWLVTGRGKWRKPFLNDNKIKSKAREYSLPG